MAARVFHRGATGSAHRSILAAGLAWMALALWVSSAGCDSRPSEATCHLDISWNEGGKVAANPVGSAGGTTWFCGDTTTLYALPDQGYHLEQWHGALSGNNPTQTLVVDGDMVIGAEFHSGKVSLTVNVSGQGSVIPSSGEYEVGEFVTVLMSGPSPGWHFVRWEGDASGTSNGFDITMDRDKTITAVFEEDPEYTLVVHVNGHGSVAPSGGTYAKNEVVTLTAIEDTNTDWVFTQWEGDASGTGLTTSVVMDAHLKDVTAVFDLCATLTINVVTGDGTVSQSPMPNGPNGKYLPGTGVTLTATPAAGYVFDGWGGDASWSETSPTIDVAMTMSKTIQVYFKHAAAGTVRSSFDAGNEGWAIWGDAQGGAATPTYYASGGNPGGYVSATDDVTGGTWYWQAPAKFHGDFSSALGQTLTFQLRQSATDSPWDAADILLTGGGKTLVLDNLAPPGTGWTQYTVSLDTSAGWRVGADGPAATTEDLQGVLGDLTDLLIRGEFRYGPDTGDLDNVVLNAD